MNWLICFIATHKWVTIFNKEGNYKNICGRCGKGLDKDWNMETKITIFELTNLSTKE